MNRKVYAKALNLLQNNGWQQGRAGNVNTKCCVGGAIAYAITGAPHNLYAAYRDVEEDLEYLTVEEHRELREALNYFADYVNAPLRSETRRNKGGSLSPDERVALWNDSDERTVEEVLQKLRELSQ